MQIFKSIALVILFSSVNNAVFADLIFSAPPRGTEAEERATYEPLVNAMSDAIGEKVQYVYPRGFIEYSTEMQKGHYDIVFDGPHFSQWRVTNLNHTILVNLPEDLQFMVLTPLSMKKVNTINDLVLKSVCAQMTPQLGTLMVLQNFYDRVAEPKIHFVHGEDNVYSDFTGGKCTAAVLRDKTYYKMSKTDRSNYKVVYKSPVAPNDAITTNNKLSAEQRKAVIKLLTNPETAKVAAPIFERFSKNAVAFDVSKPEQFEGLDQLLLIAFGWEGKK